MLVWLSRCVSEPHKYNINGACSKSEEQVPRLLWGGTSWGHCHWRPWEGSYMTWWRESTSTPSTQHELAYSGETGANIVSPKKKGYKTKMWPEKKDVNWHLPVADSSPPTLPGNGGTKLVMCVSFPPRSLPTCTGTDTAWNGEGNKCTLEELDIHETYEGSQGQSHHLCWEQHFVRLQHDPACLGLRATWGLYIHESKIEYGISPISRKRVIYRAIYSGDHNSPLSPNMLFPVSPGSQALSRPGTKHIIGCKLA